MVLSTTGYLATISSWRMGSLNILSEDELENYSWFSFTTMIPSHYILRENELSSCPHTYRCGSTWGV